MIYSNEEKIQIIKNKPENESVINYCNSIGVSKSSFYNWVKELDEANEKPSFIDVTDIAMKNVSNDIKLTIKDVSINLNSNYNEELLIRVINSLRKL